MKKTLLSLAAISYLAIGCSQTEPSAPTTTPSPVQTQVAGPAKVMTEDDAIIAVNELMGKQDFEKAIRAATEGLQQYPTSYSLLVNRASVQVHLERFAQAEPDLREALKYCPPSAQWTIHSLLGRCAAGQGMAARAEGEFQKATELLAKDEQPVPAFEEQLWRLRAENLANDLYFQESIPFYNKALAIQPDRLDSLMGRAVAYSETKQEKLFQQDLAAIKKLNSEAAEALVQELEKRKSLMSTAEGLTELGLLKLRGGEFGAGLILLTKATEKDPKFAPAFEKKGSALQSLERFPEAIEAYSKAYELNPNEVALFNRAICYLNVGETEKGKADLENFLKISKSPEEMEKAKTLLKSLE